MYVLLDLLKLFKLINGIYFVGSLQIDKLGVLSELSASKGKLFPVGFQ